MRFTWNLSTKIRRLRPINGFINLCLNYGRVFPQKNFIYAFISYSRRFIRPCTSVPCPIALGRARSSSEAACIANARNTFLRGMEVEEMWRDAAAAASFVKNKSSRDIQKWEIIPTSTWYFSSWCKGTLRICVSGYCTILHLYLNVRYALGARWTR